MAIVLTTEQLTLTMYMTSIRSRLAIENKQLEDSAEVIRVLNGDLGGALLRLKAAFGGTVPDEVIEALGT